MNRVCVREEDVVAAAASGDYDDSLVEHINQCESCREAAAMISLFQDELLNTRQLADGPNLANEIWAKAMIAQGSRRRFMRRLGVAVAFVIGLLTACAAGVAIAPSGTSTSLSNCELQLPAAIGLLLPIGFIILLTLTFVFDNRERVQP